MTTVEILPEEILPDERIAMLLSNISVGSFIPDLSKQLTKIIKEEPENSQLSRQLRLHPQYGYSPKLEEVLTAFHVGGALSTWGPTYLNEVTRGLHVLADRCRHKFSEDEINYLAKVASRLKYENSY